MQQPRPNSDSGLDTPTNVVFQSKEFAARCDRELGYRPFRSLSSIADDTLEWVPNFIPSLEQDPRDPLDP